MSFIDLQKSIEKAGARFKHGDFTKQNRQKRSDIGQFRITKAVLEHLRSLLLGQDKPEPQEILEKIKKFCAQNKHRPPSRATIYKVMAKIPSQTFAAQKLPHEVRAVLYNLDLEANIPGHQLAFYCFNYGDLRAISFAAGLPWLCLYQAYRIRGWRPKSLGLLKAVLCTRRI